MIPAQNELLRLNILFQLYNDLFKVENYVDIQRQFYKIIGCNKSQILAAIYYLDSRGSIDARSTRDKDVIQMYIRARGIDEIEDRISKGILFISANEIIPIILIKWPEEDKNYNNDKNDKDSKKGKDDKKGKNDKKDSDKKDGDDKK